MARKNSIISSSFEAGAVSIVVEGFDPLTINLTDLPKDIASRAMAHGIIQKVSDAAAIKRDELPDDPAKAAAMKYDAMREVFSRIVFGDWNAKRGDGGSAPSGLIFRALLEYTNDTRKAAKKPPVEEATLRAYYDGKTRPEQLAFRNVPAIAAIIERIKSERGGATKVDATSLLDDLANL